jgi:FkbM family methyltransferase
MISHWVVSFYKYWHGYLHLKGAGAIIRILSPFLPALHHYRLNLPEGHSITVDFRDISSIYWLNYLLGDRLEEEGLLKAVIAEMKEDSVIWDVGANCGLFSYCLARPKKVKEIVFFEPNEAMFSLAKAANQPFVAIRGLTYALSDKCGMAVLTVPTGESATGTLEADRTVRTGKETQIECKTGDQVVRDGYCEPPSIIKIDTEGHEVSVIKGLKNIISMFRPTIFFEHISLSDEEVMTLVPAGYDLYSVSDHNGSLELGLNRQRGHNSALKPQKT